ncbi:MAG: hypothetical protein DYG98_04195 [Haliscomenobacteraceae bacterium CHB4]|nr:hypothetical protein [Haliscomenobacteraceae bacterium CHB4]
MRKIVIKNFGPISDTAEIEIRPITVLLGEQATGKSTVAQCVHLFLSLGEDFVRDLKIVNQNWDIARTEEAVLNIVRSKFYAYYGSSKFLESFDIKFYYDFDANKYIHIKPVESTAKVTTNVSFSDNFRLRPFCEDVLFSAEQANGSFAQRDILLRELVTSFLQVTNGIDESPPKYFIAGRNITAAYSGLFQTYFTQNFRQPTRLGGRNIAKSAQMELTSEFILHSADMKDKMLPFRGDFEKLFEENQVSSNYKRDFIRRTTHILKGSYVITNSGDEFIKIAYRKQIPLHFASSGQQESVRILQDLALLSAVIDNTSRTIEEPEAHLFPSAQNALTELMVMTHNRTDSHFFLTTHSPYFLSSFNNLLYAAKAAGDNLPEGETPNPQHIKQVEELGYPKHLRLLAKDFAAYQLKDGTAESIYTSEKAITDIDGLDAVSSEIGDKFEALVEIVREAEEYEAA